jgi:hypothetical protein
MLLSRVVRRPEGAIDGASYIVECNGTETRLPDAAAVREVLTRAAAAESCELWVLLDRGPRRRSWLGRLLGTPARDVEPCFWLGKVGGVAVLTFLDGAWSEYRATDPDGPAAATEAERVALSCGESTQAPPELCLWAGRAFAAVAEYLLRGERPGWLAYKYVP